MRVGLTRGDRGMMGKYPCQQLHGGWDSGIKQDIDEDGRCNHEECNPEKDDRKTDVNNQYNRIQAAARFMLEAPQDAQFECFTNPGGWKHIDAANAFTCLVHESSAVRVRPTSKKVLRPAWEILRDEMGANNVIVSARDQAVFVSGINFKNVIEASLLCYGGDLSDWPLKWFTEVEG